MTLMTSYHDDNLAVDGHQYHWSQPKTRRRCIYHPRGYVAGRHYEVARETDFGHWMMKRLE